MGDQQHQWERRTSGEVDDFAHDVEAGGRGHNGPRCTVCEFTFCVHCYPEGWRRVCPGPAPEGAAWDWIGDGAGRPPEDDELETYAVR